MFKQINHILIFNIFILINCSELESKLEIETKDLNLNNLEQKKNNILKDTNKKYGQRKINKSDMKKKFKNSIEIIKENSHIKIYIVCPSKGVTIEVMNSFKKLSNFVIPESIIRKDQSKFKCLGWSNDPLYKANHLIKIIKKEKDPPIIWAMKGGNGASDLDELIINFLKPPKNIVTIIGYSDITSLHLLFLYLEKKWGKKSFRLIHGSMLFESHLKIKNPKNFLYIYNILNYNKYPEIDLIPINEIAKKCKKIKGELTGGNAAVLNDTSCGTIKQIDIRNKILILEDINERPHAIHRIITKIKNLIIWKNENEYIKCFDFVKAVIFGEYKTDSKLQKDLDQVLIDNAKLIKIPVFRTYQIGHGKDNIPWEYHKNYTIEKKNLKFKLFV